MHIYMCVHAMYTHIDIYICVRTCLHELCTLIYIIHIYMLTERMRCIIDVHIYAYVHAMYTHIDIYICVRTCLHELCTLRYIIHIYICIYTCLFRLWIPIYIACWGVLQCVAVCYSVLQCVAVYCSVLQCVLHYIAV